MNNSVSQELLKFLQKSPTAFHAVQQMKSELLAVDFTELKENQRWNIECGKHYFVTRNDSSLIAFTIPENGNDKMHILTSHSDSPTFKIKKNPQYLVDKVYDDTKKSLELGQQQLDINDVDKICELIHDAPHVFMIGYQFSRIACQDFQLKMLKLEKFLYAFAYRGDEVQKLDLIE